MNVFGLPASRRMRLSPSMGCMVIGISLIHFDILCTGNEKLELENRLDFYNFCSFNYGFYEHIAIQELRRVLSIHLYLTSIFVKRYKCVSCYASSPFVTITINHSVDTTKNCRMMRWSGNIMQLSVISCLQIILKLHPYINRLTAFIVKFFCLTNTKFMLAMRNVLHGILK